MRHLALLALCVASAAGASNIGEVMAKPPFATFRAGTTLFDTERCLLMQDWTQTPTFYRAPDRPTESLFFISSSPPIVVRLKEVSGHTDIELWKSGLQKGEATVRKCAAP